MIDNLSAPIIELQCSAIIIPEYRQRQGAEADEGLVSSIEQYGLLNPIIVKQGNVLVAGERRLSAHKKLGKLTIQARNLEDLPEDQAYAIELIENIHRQQLPWQDEALAVLHYHEMMEKKHGGWTQLATANNLGMSSTNVSRRLIVAKELDDEKVSGCQTINAALNYLEARAARAVAAATASGHQFVSTLGQVFDPTKKETKEDITAALLAEVSGETPPQPIMASTASLIEAGKQAAQLLSQKRQELPSSKHPSGSILCADFTEWAAAYDEIPFDVIHCDFPYGKNYKGANTTKQAEQSNPLYEDSPEIMFMLLEAFLKHQNNFIAPQAHCLFWHDVRHAPAIIEAFTNAGWRHCTPNPVIWTKGNSGSPGDYKGGYRHCYETAHLFSRGNRGVVKLVQDHFPHPLEEPKLHLSQKPVPMLRHFLSALCDEHTRLLDPTCGSGSAIAAANLLQVDYAIGIEMDEANAEVARFFVERRLAEEA